MQFPYRTRRSFIKNLALGLGAAPFITRGLMAQSPSAKIRHASFGTSGMAWADVTAIASHPSVEVVAGCDVDERSTAQFRKRFPNARIYSDYRELLAKESDLQSVNVSTPDHMHAPIGLACLNRGLHVYGQKPLTHDIYETRRLTETAREKKLFTQMGIQIHSSSEYRTAVKLIQDGVIGKVKEVHTWSSKKWGDTGVMPEKADPVPEGLNWDLWLGVCEERPFIGNGWYHPGNWRKRLDFGTGTFGDMGCHIYDPVFKALALTAPLSVRSEGAAPNSHSWATDAVIHYIFPGTAFTEGKTVEVVWYDGDQRPPEAIKAFATSTPQANGKAGELPDQGSIFIGTEGVMILPHIAMPRLVGESFKNFKIEPVNGANHWHQFIDAALGNGIPGANFDYSGPLTEAILLGSVATRFPKQTLEWNAEALKFLNIAEANRFVRRSYRHGWETAA
ncbi:MAG: oxidoreductase domain protein [Chthoniobacteraceae bacterium]|nr:oxidoreductase domain protein [Chthoniobacteraceae bacterium]